MKVRAKNPIQEAKQLTVDNAEELRDWTGGQLLWGTRAEDGSPQPNLLIFAKDAYSGQWDIHAHVSDWVILEPNKGFLVYPDAVFKSEYEPEVVSPAELAKRWHELNAERLERAEN